MLIVTYIHNYIKKILSLSLCIALLLSYFLSLSLSLSLALYLSLSLECLSLSLSLPRSSCLPPARPSSLLLLLAAQVDATDPKGSTALMIAAVRGHQPTVTALLNHGLTHLLHVHIYVSCPHLCILTYVILMFVDTVLCIYVFSCVLIQSVPQSS